MEEINNPKLADKVHCRRCGGLGGCGSGSGETGPADPGELVPDGDLRSWNYVNHLAGEILEQQEGAEPI